MGGPDRRRTPPSSTSPRAAAATRRFFAERGHKVTARRPRYQRACRPIPTSKSSRPTSRTAARGPCPAARFGAVVVTNYLHRPLLPALLDALAPGGVLLYETFMEGNERFGKPSRPAFLLKDGELLELVRGRFSVTAYEARMISEPKMAMVQRIAARRLREPTPRPWRSPPCAAPARA